MNYRPDTLVYLYGVFTLPVNDLITQTHLGLRMLSFSGFISTLSGTIVLSLALLARACTVCTWSMSTILTNLRSWLDFRLSKGVVLLGTTMKCTLYL